MTQDELRTLIERLRVECEMRRLDAVIAQADAAMGVER